ncbi:unnamed protein product [Clonostachys rosea f. rosea IK726]|uniref:Uncharacterized protein n=1 Tax=Clonostachys rosea f. rosea IK726 TaxID=1349383 RepID=A0ACA9TG90_BIOOC|nr:unnamed protein product [Clonostachys rosea f. rosea IK726]
MARSMARRSEPEDPSLSIRRSHTKSRRGCIICKQRKVKCDETRPRCRRCAYGDRPCSYQHDIREGEATSSKPATTPTSTSPALPTTATTTATATPGASSPTDSAASGPSWSANLVVASPVEHATFDLIHMRLLHYAHDHLADLLSIQGDTKAIINIIMDKADQEPYALDQLLALSALHLSSQHQDIPAYSQQATELQTRALSAFNRARCAISDTNYLTAFLFASMLAIHVFYDSLACLEDNLSTFIEKFVEYMRLHRGVRAVIGSHWKQILESQLQPLFYVSELALEVEKLPPGEETAPLANFLKSGSSSTSNSTDACVEALSSVQWMLDIIKLDPTRRDIAIQAIVAWPVVISDDYIEAVYQHRPEAFAVLAYYAAALHRCRDFWVFKSAGLGVVEMIARHIGPFWAEALRWPRKICLL